MKHYRLTRRIPEDSPTEFGRIVARRLNQLGLNTMALTEAVYKIEPRPGRAFHRGSSGILSNILKGQKPATSLAMEGTWVKALKLEPGSPEVDALLTAFREHQLYTVSGRRGGSGEPVLEDLAKLRAQVKRLKAENAALRARLKTTGVKPTTP